MGLSSGSVQNGAIGAGASAALMPFIEAALERSGIVGADQAALTTIIATGLGSVVGSTGGTAGAVTGANAARNVELFNRKLHKEQEIPLLEKKAQELEKERGKPESSALWEDFLLIAAGAQVDAVDQKRLQGILQLANSDDPESAAFVRDLAVAYDVVAKLSAQKIPLTWSDGRQIIADGAPVYAFNATDEQFNDSTLFNAAGTYGPGAVYERWRQYGESQTSQYSGEISNAGTYDSTVADAAARLSALAGKGVQSVSAIDDAILSLTGLRGGKVVIDAVMEVVAARQAAKTAAAEASAGKITGTVWDSVKATQPAISGTSIPKSFEIVTEGGSFWVHPNATKHMEEYLSRNGLSFNTSVSSQAMLRSFQSSLNQAASQGIKYGEVMQVGRWELIFSSGRAGDALPVVKHALYK